MWAVPGEVRQVEGFTQSNFGSGLLQCSNLALLKG